MTAKDRLFEEEITRPGDFVFDRRVVGVFPDMINRSVPGYGLIVPMIGMLARRYAMPDSLLYDLGCSLGAVSLAMRRAVAAPGARIVAVDQSPDMVERLQRILIEEVPAGLLPVEVLQRDIRALPIENASVVALNFTLQFIEPEDRGELLAGIARGMHKGGVLLLSEKICFDDPLEQHLQTDWHHDFKRAQGYSDLEIARKRDALENVLKPETLSYHRERLLEAGFERVYRWYQGFNFVSLVAFR
ncbi:MAG: carboxy-S-adenosyl-L-methionine synthase CmoA [Xanthomonadales bacterium]|nr:carboxy-S-adenosyl-L-methionine synthase CmoA [Xanthomonadales bacterium]